MNITVIIIKNIDGDCRVYPKAFEDRATADSFIASMMNRIRHELAVEVDEDEISYLSRRLNEWSGATTSQLYGMVCGYEDSDKFCIELNEEMFNLKHGDFS